VTRDTDTGSGSFGMTFDDSEPVRHTTDPYQEYNDWMKAREKARIQRFLLALGILALLAAVFVLFLCLGCASDRHGWQGVVPGSSTATPVADPPKFGTDTLPCRECTSEGCPK